MNTLLEVLQDEVRAAWRYRWHALLAAWLVCVLGWFVVLMIPNTFEATARVFVDPTTALQPVIQGIAVEQDLNTELNLVRQSLLSEPQLQKVVEKTTLGANASTDAEKAAVITSVRERVQIEVQQTTMARGEQPTPSKLYLLTYRDSDRNRSLQVIQLMLSSFVEGTLGGKREGAQKAQDFLISQIKDYEQRLAGAEQRLADFKKQNVGMVPGEQQSDFFTRLQSEMDAVQQSEAELAAAVSRRDALQRQLRGEAPIAAAGGMPSAPGSAVSGGDTLSRIKETRARLDELLLRFTDRHPDVVAARESLAQLQERRESELAALRRGDANAAAMTGAGANPVYQNIQLSLNQAEVEIASLRSKLGNHQGKVGELRRYLNTMPQVEAEYARLTRDYSVTKAQYTSMAERLEKARVGEEADASGSVRFEIIDPPSAPFRPVSPHRSLLIVGVFAGALAIGLGLAYLLSLLHPVYASSRALAAGTGLLVLGTVSKVDVPDEHRRRAWALVGYSTAALCMVVVMLAVLLFASPLAPLSSLL